MVIRVSEEASEEFRRIYRKNPNISPREAQVIEDLLYWLSTGDDITLTMAEGSLVMKRRWK